MIANQLFRRLIALLCCQSSKSAEGCGVPKGGAGVCWVIRSPAGPSQNRQTGSYQSPQDSESVIVLSSPQLITSFVTNDSKMELSIMKIVAKMAQLHAFILKTFRSLSSYMAALYNLSQSLQINQQSLWSGVRECGSRGAGSRIPKCIWAGRHQVTSLLPLLRHELLMSQLTKLLSLIQLLKQALSVQVFMADDGLLPDVHRHSGAIERRLSRFLLR